MAGRFLRKKFSEIRLDDPFFDSLKSDYPGTTSSTGFIEWFKKKSADGATALVFEDETGVGAFVVQKNEEEKLELQGSTLPFKKRLKISTFRIAERYRRQRIGEGAIGLLLWNWQKLDAEEVYVTIFNKHSALISLFERFGFLKAGENLNGENVLIRSKGSVDFRDPYRSYPFISREFDHAGYIVIDDNYHDTMFAYSEVANGSALREMVSRSVSNGLSKIYVGKAPRLDFKVGEPVLVYRRYSQGPNRRYRSCVTSFCIVTDVIRAKENNRFLMTFDQLKHRISNKSVFDEGDLLEKYNSFKNMNVVELLYYGYFGAGNNVNMDWLEKNGLWAAKDQYPTKVRLTVDQFKKVLEKGNINVSNVIIN